jgi:hypothetical protein
MQDEPQETASIFLHDDTSHYQDRQLFFVYPYKLSKLLSSAS